MNFKEKMRCAYYKIKTKLIVAAILVLAIIILAVAPMSIGVVKATKAPKKQETNSSQKKDNYDEEESEDDYYNEDEENYNEEKEDNKEESNVSHVDLSPGFDWYEFFTALGEYLPAPNKSIPLCFTKEYFSTFLKGIEISVFVYIIVAGIGFYKAIPKHEYDDVEHGSSKWSEGGEQYAILSKKKGIILAEKNYLPVDKRGNVNVLVVRRFRCW